jgi:hypothetical protein
MRLALLAQTFVESQLMMSRCPALPDGREMGDLGFETELGDVLLELLHDLLK